MTNIDRIPVSLFVFMFRHGDAKWCRTKCNSHLHRCGKSYKFSFVGSKIFVWLFQCARSLYLCNGTFTKFCLKSFYRNNILARRTLRSHIISLSPWEDDVKLGQVCTPATFELKWGLKWSRFYLSCCFMCVNKIFYVSSLLILALTFHKLVLVRACPYWNISYFLVRKLLLKVRSVL